MKEYREMISGLPRATKILMLAGFGVMALAIGYFIIQAIANGFSSGTSRKTQAKFNGFIILLVIIAVSVAGGWLKDRFFGKKD